MRWRNSRAFPALPVEETIMAVRARRGAGGGLRTFPLTRQIWTFKATVMTIPSVCLGFERGRYQWQGAGIDSASFVGRFAGLREQRAAY